MPRFDIQSPAVTITLLPIILVVLVYAASGPTVEPTPRPKRDAAPKNVILLIGDGMGPQQMGLLFDWASAAGQTPTAMEEFLDTGTVGLIRTRAYDTPATDSAAAGTAMACGVLTNNGFIAMDPQKRPVRTALDDAVATGRVTGLVSTARVTHATPACFAAHIDDREKEDVIAQQLVESDVDVILGGGSKYFLSARQNLSQRMHERGWTLVTTGEQLDRTRRGDRVFGLFSTTHYPYVLDRDEAGEAKPPTLPELTKKALELVDDPTRGFFLMVESGRIDHAGHASDVASILGEMREFDDTIALVLDYQQRHPETLVLMTADHETGGLSITYGLNGKLTDDDFLAMAEEPMSVEVGIDKNLYKLGPTDPEPLGVGRHPYFSVSYRAQNYRALERSSQFHVAFGTGNHTTTPVIVAARGPGAETFHGLHPNTWIGQQLRRWMQIPPR